MYIPQVRQHALSLPDVTEKPHHHFPSFWARGSIFVTVPPDGLFIHAFVDEQQRETALALHPAFVQKLLWGGKVVGLRVALKKPTPAVVRQWVLFAWQFEAPAPAVKGAHSAPGKQPGFDWHTDPISPATPVDSAHKNTQNVRRFLIGECGVAFKFPDVACASAFSSRLKPRAPRAPTPAAHCDAHGDV